VADGVVELVVEDGVAVITADNPPVNALSAAMRRGLVEALERAEADPAVRAVVIACAGRTFFAGADISEFGKAPQPPGLPEVVDRIEACLKPVAAAIHGTALGGGLEVALGCHARVAVASAKLGLPEVSLGLLPGAGGTQRLPRIVGVEAALEMITSGKPIGAKAAEAAGLVDAIAPEDGLRAAACARARTLADRKTPLRRVRDREIGEAGPEVFDAFRKANARKFRGFRAPEAAIRAVEAAVRLPFDQGAAEERRLFLELLVSPESAAQRYAFFAERAAAKVPDVPDDTVTLPVRKVGMIGAGTMGGGIAMNFLNAGIPVTIVEARRENLDRGVGVMRRNYEASAAKGRFSSEEVERRMGALTPTLELERLCDCDLIIEAVFEDMSIKREVFGRLDRIARADAILASNTSYLDIDEIAAATSRPEQVIGLHFFSPANVMRLLEVVRGAKTSNTVVATAMKLGKSIGKVAVLSGVCHGFIGNRMLSVRQEQANALILEGARPADVDRVMHGFGLPMGPFAMADLAGLDIGWSRETSTGESVRDRLCEMDRRGQKTGGGFYDYDAQRKATPSAAAEQVIRAVAGERGIAQREVGDQEILERLLYPMVNEGALILEEGIAAKAGDIDVVWVNGYGWPVYRGGPMFWADQVGLKTIVEALEGYRTRLGGAAFEPAPLLRRLAEGGGRFTA